MTYSLFILRRAQKELAALPDEAYVRVRGAIRALAANPRPPGVRKLAGREAWRIRIGDLSDDPWRPGGMYRRGCVPTLPGRPMTA